MDSSEFHLKTIHQSLSDKRDLARALSVEIATLQSQLDHVRVEINKEELEVNV